MKQEVDRGWWAPDIFITFEKMLTRRPNEAKGRMLPPEQRDA
jgi:hypothetical protein